MLDKLKARIEYRIRELEEAGEFNFYRKHGFRDQEADLADMQISALNWVYDLIGELQDEECGVE